MLTILIPIYNTDVTSLVGDLVEQARFLGMPVEIICVDDHSEIAWKKRNAPIRSLDNVTYKELPSNQGRSKIRNHLASMARHPMLLFLDSDSKIIRQDFLAKYIQACHEEMVIVGGRTYPPKCPGNAFRLHWKYGSRIEEKAVSGFQSNNFLIPASIFRNTPFDESLSGYGHEDTLFGYQLATAGISILRIDNPVMHDKLETNLNFLENQMEAISNLLKLKASHPEIETKLTQVIKQLEKYKLSTLTVQGWKWSQKLILRNLKSHNPSLTLLDFFKLGFYLTEQKNAYKEKETILG